MQSWCGVIPLSDILTACSARSLWCDPSIYLSISSLIRPWLAGSVGASSISHNTWPALEWNRHPNCCIKGTSGVLLYDHYKPDVGFVFNHYFAFQPIIHTFCIISCCRAADVVCAWKNWKIEIWEAGFTYYTWHTHGHVHFWIVPGELTIPWLCTIVVFFPSWDWF